VIGVITINEKIEPTDYPTLTPLAVDLSTDYQVKVIIRDIVKLNKNIQSTQILLFEAANDKLTTMVQIPRNYLSATLSKKYGSNKLV
jgi:hypothetical protein